MKRILVFFVLLCLLFYGCYSCLEAQWSNDPTVNTPVCLVEGGQRLPQIVSDGMCGAIIC